MKTATVTMMSIFLVIALSCVIAQEFAIHLLYNRCESMRSAYNQLAMSKTKILYIPYAPNEQLPTYSPVDPHAKAPTLAVKNKNPLTIKNLENNIDTIDKLVSRFLEAKGKQFEVYVLFLCNHLSIDRDEKIDLIHRTPDFLRAASQYESSIDLLNELFASHEAPKKIE